MKEYTIKQYQKTDFNTWNVFIAASKNATFLFHRDFMEYHADRFVDHSLVVLDGEKWVAVLPANQVKDVLHSHQGLTYGGLVLLPESKLYNTIYIFKSILKYLSENNISKLCLKQLPAIYCDLPSEEINYLMFICKGIVTMRHNISTISLNQKNDISRIRKRGITKGSNNNLKVIKENDVKIFWNELLIPNLKNKYKADPVHSLFEIQDLMLKFPDNIHHYNTYHNQKLVAGITLFVNKKVVKSQYISNSDLEEDLGSLDFLTNFVINTYAHNKTYFDFGPSHINNGLNIVQSLNYFKESLGAHSVVQDFYEVETKNYPLLDSILI
jgi:hypothetical protein